jgi:hypothetical protein
LREQGLSLFVLHAGVNDNIITGNPVDWSRNTVLVPGLEGIDNSEDFGGVTSSGCGVGEDEADGLFGVDDEDGTDRESNTL